MARAAESISIERHIKQIAEIELRRVRRPEPSDTPADRDRRARANADRRHVIRLTRELYGIMRRQIPPGKAGTDRRELAAKLRALTNGVLTWCEDNARPLKQVRPARGRPPRMAFDPVIDRLRVERGMAVRSAAKFIANQLVTQHWRPERLNGDDFDGLFPNVPRGLAVTQIRDRLAESLRVAYDAH